MTYFRSNLVGKLKADYNTVSQSMPLVHTKDQREMCHSQSFPKGRGTHIRDIHVDRILYKK